MKNDRETKNTDAATKGLTDNILPYEKPKVEKVKLFADQVLHTCGKNDPHQSSCQDAGALDS